MLQSIRSGIQGTAAKVIIGLICVSFAIFGIESILVGTSRDDVAEVNGEAISAFELQQAVNNQQRRLLAAMGDAIDPTLLDEARLSQQALQELIQRRVIEQRARELGLTATDEVLGAMIADMGEFQAAGQFSPELYRNALSMAGYTPISFREILRTEVVTGQLQLGLAGSEFVTPAELQLAARYDNERRDFRYLTIPRDRFEPSEPFSEEAYLAYYEANTERFRAGESVELDYIELTPKDFERPISEQRLLEYWELERDDYVVPDEIWVSHILLTQESGESRNETLARAQAVRERAVAGEDFAALAQEFSRDAGSARSGGQLGFTTGDIFDPAMEEAISTLDEGGISEPVRTDAGWHIIRVDEVRSGSAPEFAQVRGELEQRLQAQQSRELLVTTVERLKDLVFNAENLQGPARELELQVERSDRIYRDQRDGLFANPQLLAEAFSADVLESGYNSDVIELPENRHVVMRLAAFHEAQILPLEEVREQVAEALTAQAIAAARAELVAQIKERLAAGEAMDQLAQALSLDWQVALGTDRNDAAVPLRLRQRIFAEPAADLSGGELSYYEILSSDSYLVQFIRAQPGQLASLSEPERALLRQRLGSERGRLTDQAYQQSLLQSATVKRL